MPRPNSQSPEERWLLSLRKALVAAGAPVSKVARRIAEALDAEYVEVVKHQGAITDEKAYADHPTRLKAAAMATEIHAPRPAARGSEGRTMLVVAGDAKIQLMMFGDVVPEGGTLAERESVPVTLTVPMSPDHSSELKAAMIRAGKRLPGGEAPRPAEANSEGSKGQEHREGWLR